MSIALDTIHADLARELRSDLSATRNALQRAEEANESMRRQIESLNRAIRTLEASIDASHLRLKTVLREIK